MQTIQFNNLAIAPGQCVLDVGCGEGRHAIGALYAHNNIHVIAVDMSAKDLNTAVRKHREFDFEHAKRCAYVCGDGCQLPLADASVDHVVCSEVLEHIPDYKKMLAELVRVLKPGGTLNISVPRYWPEKICWLLSRDYHQVAGGHIRIFKSRDLRDKVQQFNFTLRKFHGAHALHVPYWWLRCAFWQTGEQFFLVRWYHKLLVWDLLHRPWLTRTLEACLNPVCGKSIVMYFQKSETNKP